MLKALILRLAPSYLPNLVRQAGLLAGGALMNAGVVDPTGAEFVAGAVTAVGMGLWALAEKRGLVQKLFS